MRKIFFLCLCCLLLLAAACGRQQSAGGGSGIVLTDDNGRRVELTKRAERIVALSPSFLELLEAVDGKVAGRAESAIARLPESAKAAASVGYIFNINSEKVVELQPDLVVAYKGMHERYLPLFESNKIPVLVLSLKTYEDVKHSLQILGQATGQPKKGERAAAELDRQIREMADRLPRERRRAAILHSSAQNVTLESDSSIAGSIIKLLGLENIAGQRPGAVIAARQAVPGERQAAGGKQAAGAGTMQDMRAAAGGSVPDMAPFSMENLVTADPEVIFITSMGSRQEIEARLQESAMGSPAWKTITAVKNKQVFYLPDELFLLNPGLRYPLAVQLVAAKLYPDKVKEPEL